MSIKAALIFVALCVPFFMGTIWAIVDVAQKDFGTTGQKALWWLVSSVPFIGFIIYLIFGMRKGKKTGLTIWTRCFFFRFSTRYNLSRGISTAPDLYVANQKVGWKNAVKRFERLPLGLKTHTSRKPTAIHETQHPTHNIQHTIWQYAQFQFDNVPTFPVLNPQKIQRNGPIV